MKKAERSSPPVPERGLEGYRTIVTGASSGVGMAAAQAFVAEGARVALVARRSEILAELASDLGKHAVALPADLTDPDAVANVVTAAHQAFGGLDLVVNAAAVAFGTSLEDLTPQVWRQVIDTNLSGTFYVCRAAGLRMRDDGGGTIVNVGSELSSVGMSRYSHYCASKFGVVGLTKALAAELAPTVRVNIVCPGPIDTPMSDATFDSYPDPEAARRETLARVPLKRLATADEVVAAIRFLAVDARFATGAVLPLDGGTTIT
jgi:NAD(P)-dependent dehydrogenase (short-subunit alcohol dehydrogenase family)